MSLIVFYAALVCILSMLSPYPLIGLGIGFGVIFLRIKHNRKWVLILLGVFLLRLQINLPKPQVQSARIVELNAQSYIAYTQGVKVLVSVKDIRTYGIGDEIQLKEVEPMHASLHQFGFDLNAWTQANSIVYIAQEENTIQSPSSGFMHWLSMGGNSDSPEFIEWVRRLFFQSSASGVLGLLISSGFLFQSLFNRLLTVGKYGVHTSIVMVLELILFLYLGYSLGYPLALIRVFVGRILMHLIQDSRDRWSMSVLILSFIQPYGWTQIAWLLPISLSFFSYYAPTKYTSINRSFMMMVLLHIFQIRFGVLELLLYPFIRRLFGWILSISFILSIFPIFIRPWVGCLKGLDEFLIALGKIGVQTGQLTWVMASGLLLYFLWSERLNPFLWTLGWGIIILVGIPMSAVPLFYQITYLNVGQGDATLLQAPFNASVILIDTGNQYASTKVQAILDAYAIHSLDALIITHPDADHSANMASLCTDYNIKQMITQPQNIQLGNYVLKALPLKESKDENDGSLIYTLSMFDRTFLFTGDISVTAEKDLIQLYNRLKIDVLKVAHHGSKSSSSKDFLHQIEAKVAIISVGENTYGHPHISVLERLRAYQVNLFTTLSSGDIQILLTPYVHWIIPSHSKSYWF